MRFFDLFNKQYLKRTLVTMGSGVLALGFIFYISYHLTESFAESLGLQNAVYVDESQIIHADGYIFRSEKVLYAGQADHGSVTPAVSDGTKLARYDKAADIYEGTSPDVLARMTELDTQLELLEKSADEDVSQVSTSGLDSAIFQSVQNIRTQVESGALDEAVTMRTDFLLSIQKKDIFADTGSGTTLHYTSRIQALQEEKSSLRSQLGACLETYYVPQSGYYFSPSTVDGYESLFQADTLTDMAYDDFLSLITKEPETYTGSSQCVGKLVTDYRWYLACPMSKTEAATLEDGYTYSVTFPYNGNTTLRMTLQTVIPELPGTGAIAVFQCEKMPTGFDYTRMQPVQVATAEYRGFQVPTSAIRILDGYEGVYVLDEVTVVFKRIQIVYEGDGYYICTDSDTSTEEDDCPYGWLRMNDVIITEGTGLEVGKVISAGNSE